MATGNQIHKAYGASETFDQFVELMKDLGETEIDEISVLWEELNFKYSQ